MPAVNKVLVVGSGLAGTATAILLAQEGVAVDLVEVKPEVAAIGSGITLQGNALRELRRLGAWPRARAAGFAFDCLGLRAPDAGGTLLAQIPDVRSGGADLPATMGMPRPVLARILLDRAADSSSKTSRTTVDSRQGSGSPRCAGSPPPTTGRGTRSDPHWTTRTG